MYRPKTNKGFTLIELLVVISIISVLSSVVLVTVNSARIKSRDSFRAQSIGQLMKALELYYDDNGKYPQITGTPAGSFFIGDESTYSNALQSALSPYLNNLPVDPMSRVSDPESSWGHWFRYVEGLTGDQYAILINFEQTGYCLTGSKPRGCWFGAHVFCSQIPPVAPPDTTCQ